MRRPIPYLVCGLAVMIALIIPALQLHLTGGDNRGVPLTTEFLTLSVSGHFVYGSILGVLARRAP